MEYELIHVNLALAKFPLRSEAMQSFWDQEAPIYAMAKQYAGFSREITFPDRFSVFGEPHIFNATAWTRLEDLKTFVYTGMHAQAIKDRKQWFTETPYSKYTLFWVEKDTVITEQFAANKLKSYAQYGPTQDAFDFKTPFNPA